MVADPAGPSVEAMSQTLTLPPTAPAGRAARRRRTCSPAPRYVLTGFPLALAAFVLLVTGTALGLGTLVIVVGFAVLALTLAIAQGFARAGADPASTWRWAAGCRARRTGRSATAPSAGCSPPAPTRAAGWTWCTASWRSRSPGATFGLVVGWWSAAVGGTGYVLWEWALPRDDPDNTSLAD